MGLLDLIFPKKCVVCKKDGSYICDNCFSYLSFDTKNTCLVCNKHSIDGYTHKNCLKKNTIDGCFSSLYLNKTAYKLIYSFKNKPYLKDLENVLSDFLYEGLIQNEAFNKELEKENRKKWIITYVPLHSLIYKKRGYNQAEIIARNLGKRLNIKAVDLLIKTKNTIPQAKLKGKRRKNNLRGVFSLKAKNFKLEGSRIFIIDDFVNTGTTLQETARALKEKGAKKAIGISLAK